MVEKNNYSLYFTNDMYDDQIINSYIQSFQNRLYYNILNTRKHIQKNILKTGSISDFVIDHALNVSYGLPEFTYSLEIKDDVIPYYSEKQFADKYRFNTLISSTDIMKDGYVFCKGYYLFIGDYYIYDVTVSIHRHGCTIFLTSVNTDILTEYFSQNPDMQWYILVKSQSDCFYGYQPHMNIFDGRKVLFSGFSDIRKFILKNKRNSWTMFVSARQDAPNLMTMTRVSLKTDADGSYFEMSEKFQQYLESHPFSVKCMIINEPECNCSGVYLVQENTDPVFQIPFEKNPIPIENITVWTYDKENDRKLHVITSPDIGLRYPNIYDFTNVIGDNDLYIEWFEPDVDIMKYDSYIEDYIECYGDDFATMIKNNTAESLVQNYLPVSDINVTSEDYAQSPLKGDIRAWKLDKLIRLLKDNPKRYDEFLRKIYTNIKKYANYSYTYETKQYVYERSIMDNNAHCKSQDEVKMIFTEPHTYIKLYNTSCDTPPVALYINGELKWITYVMAFGSELYIYFPTRYIENHEDIQVDVMLDDNKVIDKVSFAIHYVGGEYFFNDAWKMDTHSISDLLFYDATTGRILDTNFVDFSLKVTIDEIQYIGDFGVEKPDFDYSLEKLYDNNGLVIQPTDYDFIYLKGVNIKVDIDRDHSHKKINLNNVYLKLNDTTLTERKIYAATTNFFQYRLFENNDGTTEYFEIKNFKGKQTTDRFRIYVDGKLQRRESYSFDYPNTYDTNIRINNISLDIGKLEVIYQGYDEKLIYEDTVGSLKGAYNDIMFLDFMDLSFNPELCAIFIDGYRIHLNQIKILGQSNMIIIDDLYHRITDESIITILMQDIDPDPYEYESQDAFLSTLVKNNRILKDFMVRKYIDS